MCAVLEAGWLVLKKNFRYMVAGNVTGVKR